MSEPNGPGSESRAAAQQLAETEAEDPWFDPGPKPRGYQSLATDQDAATAHHQAAGNGQSWHAAGSPGGPAEPGPDGPQRAEEWFLPTGRAGLLPESMTESWEPEATRRERHETAGAPPWAGERPAQDVAEPPPWESGPWPGPGEARPAGRRAPAARSADTGPAESANWQAKAAVVAGIFPLVVPGAILGVLGLRRARVTGAGWLASWAGIVVSALWAVLLIMLATGGSGGPGCASGSQAAVNRAMQSVLSDLATRASPPAVSASMTQALGQANSAAVAADQVTARNALLTLTSALERASASVLVNHSATSYAGLRRQLAADSLAVTSACKG